MEIIPICRNCGNESLELIETPKLVHYGKYICKSCKSFNGWCSNPNNTGRRKTSKHKLSQVVKYHNYNVAFCFFCLRKREQLGMKETLTLDHIEELAEGGVDEIYNLQILCSVCHKLKNWARLYMNWHLNITEDSK